MSEYLKQQKQALERFLAPHRGIVERIDKRMPPRTEPKIVSCEWCRELFETYQTRQKYCGDACRQAAYKQRLEIRKMERRRSKSPRPPEALIRTMRPDAPSLCDQCRWIDTCRAEILWAFPMQPLPCQPESVHYTTWRATERKKI